MQKNYIKAIYNGDIIEFYVMEKSPMLFQQKHEEKVEPKEGLEWIYDVVENRKESRRSQTLRDAKNTMRRLAIRNFKPNESLFITLTYRWHNTDLNLADKHFGEFVKAIRDESGQAFQYLAVREFTKKGRVHFHLLTDFKIDGDSQIDLERWERDVAKVWGEGFVDIKITNHIDNVGAYLSKYMSKEIASDYYFKNKKYYLCSQGLKRPEVFTGEIALALYNSMNKKNEVFTNSYESEYLGKITYIEFNLNRLNKNNLKII